MKNLYLKLNLMLIGLMFAMPVVARAEDAPAASVLPDWLMALINKIPFETIAWVVAAIGLLNGIVVGLDGIVKKTASTKDDAILASVGKVLATINSVLKFFVAKPVLPAPAPEQPKQ